MSAYLIDHPPRVRQFRDRGTTVSGVFVVHTAESLPDFTGPDLGAEGVARFIQGRTDFGSYHWLADSDSLIDLVPLTQQAYGDGTGSNPHAIHISAATQAARWPGLPDAWVDDTILNMAEAAHRSSEFVYSVHKVRVPAKRISRAESDRRVEGFISHAERDPARRSDPGSAFPWSDFLDAYSDLERGETRVKPSRGKQVDVALRKVSGAITALEKATGPEPREEKIAAALADLRKGRRDLRSMAILKSDAVKESRK